MSDLSLGDAARALGVSVDTLRRWDRDGKLETTRDERNRRRVPGERGRAARSHPERHRTGDTLSTRNRFPGVVTSVEVDGVMALVEIEAGPHRVTAAITRDAVEELGLAEGVEATAHRQGDLGDGRARRGRRCDEDGRSFVVAAVVAAIAAGLRQRRLRARAPRPRRRRAISSSSPPPPRSSRRSPPTPRQPGIDAKQSFAGSDDLAAQIRQGVTPDVYAAANTSLPDDLYKDGLVEKPVVFATNTLVLAVPAGLRHRLARRPDRRRDAGDRGRGRPGR